MGAKLVLAARRTDALLELVEECRRSDGMAEAKETDVSVQSDIQELYDFTIESFGTLSYQPFAKVFLYFAMNASNSAFLSNEKLLGISSIDFLRLATLDR